MGFSGGGTGSFSLPNHEHTNVLEDGGQLDEAVSLIDDEGAPVTLETWLNTAIAAGAPTSEVDTNTTGDQTINSTDVDLNDMAVTLPNNTGKSLVIITARWYSTTLGASANIRFLDAAAGQPYYDCHTHVAGQAHINTYCYIADNDGQVIKAQGKWGSSQSWVFTSSGSTIMALELN
jgi:hypothetical protein